MKKKILVLSTLTLGATVCAAVMFSGKKEQNRIVQDKVITVESEQSQQGSLSAEEIEALDVHTWEEYQSLSPEAQEAFYQKFDSAEDFEEYVSMEKEEETTQFSLTWDNADKEPIQYSWEEYLELSYEDQEKFYQWFDSKEVFEEWMASVKPEETTVAVEIWSNTGKQPNEYSWEEYQDLSGEDKEAFFEWFDNADEFNEWVDSVEPEPSPVVVTKWNKSGKDPDEYSWEEYQDLSGEDQEKFYQWFGSIDAFEAWMESVKPEETTASVEEWNKTGKNPDEYTWKEYQKLSDEDQERFYQWFDSEDAFEAWMDSVEDEIILAQIGEWNKSGKKPNEYTWEEYKKLSGEDQERFYQWFGSVEKFETWMNAAKDEEDSEKVEKWNKSGKKPNEYTWEEYQELSPQEQDSFFQWFGSVDAFEEWMYSWQEDLEEDAESEETEADGM